MDQFFIKASYVEESGGPKALKKRAEENDPPALRNADEAKHAGGKNEGKKQDYLSIVPFPFSHIRMGDFEMGVLSGGNFGRSIEVESSRCLGRGLQEAMGLRDPKDIVRASLGYTAEAAPRPTGGAERDREGRDAATALMLTAREKNKSKVQVSVGNWWLCQKGTGYLGWVGIAVRLIDAQVRERDAKQHRALEQWRADNPGSTTAPAIAQRLHFFASRSARR